MIKFENFTWSITTISLKICPCLLFEEEIIQYSRCFLHAIIRQGIHYFFKIIVQIEFTQDKLWFGSRYVVLGIQK